MFLNRNFLSYSRSFFCAFLLPLVVLRDLGHRAEPPRRRRLAFLRCTQTQGHTARTQVPGGAGPRSGSDVEFLVRSAAERQRKPSTEDVCLLPRWPP